MKHLNTTELEKFVNGKLDAKQLLEMDEHICGCAECKAAVSDMFASKKTALDLGAMLLGTNDCPEYEELSAYVDNALDIEQTKVIKSHVNSCEPCTRDVGRMAELRSHAMMRPSVTVAPGMSKRPARTATPIWKRVLAGTGALGVAAFSAYMFFGLLRMGDKPAPVAKAPTTTKQHQVREAALPEKKLVPSVKKPTIVPEKSVVEKPVMASKPETLLRDGEYSVIKVNGKLQVAKADSGSPRTALEARIAASIAQKLRTGKVKLTEPYDVASLPLSVRSNGGNNSSEAIAPKLIGPSGKILLTDSPLLKWSKVDMAESYKVTVYDKAGRVVIEQTTEKTAMIVPVSLTRGEVYQWRVGVRRSESETWAMSAAAKFAVISEKGFNTIHNARTQMPGSHLALGVAYESCGLYSEARREYDSVRHANQGSKLARKLR